jgi:succinate dehydrogenase / fumarate reductase cytochrome b subunit
MCGRSKSTVESPGFRRIGTEPPFASSAAPGRRNETQDRTMTTAPKQRPKYYDLNLAHLPLPGLVSIFHRVSGAILFVPVIPLLLYLMQATLGSEAGWLHWKGVLAEPAVKLVLLAFVWLYAHHFFAGIRYLLLDMHIGIALAPARSSAKLVFALGAVATLLIGWRLW